MKEFTFAAITYNHSDFIIEHLESLKLVIQTYGKGYLTNLVISDDCSKDDTVELAKKWVETNRELFYDVKIVVPPENQGIVKNYIQALKNIHTNKFKIIAGDDLYLCEDIYSISQLSDMVLTPLVSFAGSTIVNNSAEFIAKEMIYYRNKNLKKIIQDKLKYSMYISSPGAMWDLSFADEKMFEILSNYKWIEDIPLYSYLINKENLNVWFCETPIIAYRSDVGISKNKNHERAKQYNEEWEKISKSIYTHRRFKIKFLNPYVYKLFLNRCYIKYIKSSNKQIKSFEKNYLSVKLKAQQVIGKIYLNADVWKNNNL